MNITSANPAPGAFANGFDFFCTDCGRFFSVQSNDDGADRAYHCPYCGKDEPLTTVIELLTHCDFNFTAPSRPTSQSRSRAPAPRQNRWNGSSAA
jgi:hypothetical protein